LKRRNIDLEDPNMFKYGLDEEIISDISQNLIAATNEGAANREINQYHLKRLSEQAEGMSNEEAMAMCKHFDPIVLLRALEHHLNIATDFQSKFVSITKEMVDKLNE